MHEIVSGRSTSHIFISVNPNNPPHEPGQIQTNARGLSMSAASLLSSALGGHDLIRVFVGIIDDGLN